LPTRPSQWPHVALLSGLAILAAAWLGGPRPAAANPAPTHRQMIQHLLRRFAFSASPEAVDAVLASAGGAGWRTAADLWLQQQFSATTDINAFPMEAPPGAAPLNGSANSDPGFERGYIEHSIGTNQQLRAKLELHWLDHFSVVGASTSGWTDMLIYDYGVRQNALGNFQTLLTAVAETPAELQALSNANNIGSDPKTPPNVNFARELMQIFTIGPFKLNMDGSEQLDPQGRPLLNYGDGDIFTLAYAMTGYGLAWNPQTTNPLLAVTTTYTAANHYAGVPASYNGMNLSTFMGKPFSIPSGQDPIAYVVSLLARNPSTAPFQARELLRRFVTEKPSRGYISRIASVWRANVDAPNQIAAVVKAIVDDPEFASSYQSMPKQPIETIFQLARQLPATFAPLTTTPGYGSVTSTGASTILYALQAMGQDPYNPATVFSFYPPGQVEAANSNVEYLSWMNWMQYTVTSDQTWGWPGVWIDMPALRQRIATANGSVSPSAITGAMVADYLVDAMIDGGAQARRTALIDLMGATPSDQLVRSAIWLIAASPEYIVN